MYLVTSEPSEKDELGELEADMEEDEREEEFQTDDKEDDETEGTPEEK